MVYNPIKTRVRSRNFLFVIRPLAWYTLHDVTASECSFTTWSQLPGMSMCSMTILEGNEKVRGSGHLNAPHRSQRMLSSVCTPVLPSSPRTGCLVRQLLNFFELSMEFSDQRFPLQNLGVFRVRCSTQRTSQKAVHPSFQRVVATILVCS